MFHIEVMVAHRLAMAGHIAGNYMCVLVSS